jgi:alpha-mannosidase
MFGNGDGGGGPSAVMLERLRRTRATGLHSDRSGEQLPLVKTGFSLSEFFEHTRKQTDNGKSLPAWYVCVCSLGITLLTSRVGELYLERHRAVQTSQARTKRNFRISEHLIREAEYISTLASIQTEYSYPKEVSHQVQREV